MDSIFKVPLTKILAVDNHPNADKLSMYTVYGFQIIGGLNQFKPGDNVIYIPIDSIISKKLEDILFKNSKIKPNKGRIRQIRIRGSVSQGLLVNPIEIESIVNTKFLKLEQDLKEILGIEKFEPVEKGPASTLGKLKKGRKNLAHPDFHSYNGLPNLKWMPELFQEGEMVVIQEKLHGTNARAAKLPYRANTVFKRIKQWLGLAPKFESLYGSNRVDISNASTYKGYYGEDIYGKTFEKLGVFGLKQHEFVVFDVKVLNEDGTQEWMEPSKVQEWTKCQGFKFVPVLYEGPFNKALLDTMISGPSVFDPNEKVREGIVVKASENYTVEGDNKDNTDFH